jgi:hypothetical protein
VRLKIETFDGISMAAHDSKQKGRAKARPFDHSLKTAYCFFGSEAGVAAGGSAGGGAAGAK